MWASITVMFCLWGGLCSEKSFEDAPVFSTKEECEVKSIVAFNLHAIIHQQAVISVTPVCEKRESA